MKRLFLFSFSVLYVLGYGLLISSEAIAAASTEQSIVKVTDAKGLEYSFETNGRLAYDAKKGQKVFVLFRGSAEITGILARALAAGGAQLENDRAKADVVVEIQAYFEADRGRRHISGHIGSSMNDELGESYNLYTLVAHPRYGDMSSLKGTSIASVLTSVAEASGLSAWINTHTVGDPEGICILQCDYKQKLQFEVWASGSGMPSNEGYISYVLRTDDRTLRSEAMLAKALQIALSGMGVEYDN